MNVSAYIAQRSRALGLDPKAVLAIARQEGLSGGVGDHGTSFGPFQLHQGGALPSGIPLSQAQSWAESPAGINYALNRINQVAHGLRGAQAISAISRGFERPANPSAEIAGAMSAYGKGVGSSPALAMTQLLSGGGGSQGGFNQLLSSYLLSQAQSGLQGNSSPAEQGQGLLELAMARRAMGAGGEPALQGGGASYRGPSVLQGGNFAGGFLPKGAVYKPGRKDQGQDGQTNPGGPVIAPGDGKVISVKSDPNGFGPAYPVVHFTSGPYAGRDIYIGHTISQLQPGQQFRAGQVISVTGKTGVGNATVPGWFEIGLAPGGSPGQFGQPVPF